MFPAHRKCQTSAKTTPQFSPLTAASVLCIPCCGGQADLLKGGWVLWYTACLAQTGGDSSISATTSPSCRFTGCSSLLAADGYVFMSAEPVLSRWTCSNKYDFFFSLGACDVDLWMIWLQLRLSSFFFFYFCDELIITCLKQFVTAELKKPLTEHTLFSVCHHWEGVQYCLCEFDVIKGPETPNQCQGSASMKYPLLCFLILSVFWEKKLRFDAQWRCPVR